MNIYRWCISYRHLDVFPQQFFAQRNLQEPLGLKKNVKKTKKLLIQKYYLSCLADKWILFFGSIC